MKQVLDLDQVLSSDWVVQENQTIDLSYANRVINTYDELGLEMMLRLQDQDPNCKSISMTVGTEETESMLRKALALSVGEAIRIDQTISMDQMPQAVARLLCAGIQKIGDVDLVICGRQASGSDYGQTGLILAELLNWPCMSLVTEVVRRNDQWIITHQVDDGLEEVVVEGPVVLTMTQSADHFLRMATLRNTMVAKKKEITLWSLADLEKWELAKKDAGVRLSKIFTIEESKDCVMLDGPEIFVDRMIEEMQHVNRSEGVGL
jgi:electron transfer flavoprotein beta subunit